MKSRNIILGFLFIVLGSLWILSNLDIINFSIGNIIWGITDLWPLVLVIIGINLIIKNKKIKLLLWILFIIIIIFYGFFIHDDIFTGNSNDFTGKDVSSINMEDKTEKGKLDLDIGAAKFEITSGNSDLVTIFSNRSYNYKSQLENSLHTVYLSNDGNFKTFNFKKNERFYYELNLNESIPWSFDIDCGAVDGKLNLKNIDVEEFSLDMGAGKIEVDLGEKSKLTNIDINSGVSKVVLNIPKESGIRVKLDGALNSTNLDEIKLNKEGNHYISDNFNDVSSKYDINIEMGLGNFKINYF
ncbi:hypothetical protein GOQ29_07685 [Clostridium sp. D2Q-14]|uniref:LiaF transmembrane domain-containing protein n=1 Tax=Anaeromonas gelatinilytica TaxID=2683194 RepID=UPI00193BADEC|nr:DUF5668 domain-containing protein [Anaeromonas gelatinilytica]MBS4535501.1 hypothetical protein [Anaeromonas gelatinilytica]